MSPIILAIMFPYILLGVPHILKGWKTSSTLLGSVSEDRKLNWQKTNSQEEKQIVLFLFYLHDMF